MRDYAGTRSINYKVRKNILEKVHALGAIVKNSNRSDVCLECLEGLYERRWCFRAHNNSSFKIQSQGKRSEQKNQAVNHL